MVRLRLSRQGRKGRPFYYIVAADSRSPRDGKFLEKIGTYNPMLDPAVIDINHESALKWLQNGAQPSDTVRSLLRYTGINLKHALASQGKNEEEIEAIYSKWKAEKDGKIEGKKERLTGETQAKATAAHAAESKVREAKAAAIVAKNTPPVVEKAEEVVAPEAEAVATEEAPASEESAE